MPGTIQVSVLGFTGLHSSVTQSQMSIKVSLGKREYMTWDKGDFSFPLTSLRNDLVVTLQDADGNEISHTGVETKLVIEKGFWDDLFPLEGGGHVHMKLQFILNEDDRKRIRMMRESVLKRKQDKLLNSSERDRKNATATVATIHPEVSDSRRLLPVDVASIKVVPAQDDLAANPLNLRDSKYQSSNMEGDNLDTKKPTPNDTDRSKETSWYAPASVGADGQLTEVSHRDLVEKTETLLNVGDVPVRDNCSEDASSSLESSESTKAGNNHLSTEDGADGHHKQNPLEKVELNHRDLVERTEDPSTAGGIPVRDVFSEEASSSLEGSKSAMAANDNSQKDDGIDDRDKQNPLVKAEVSHMDLVERTEVLLTSGSVPVRDVCSEETSSSLECSESAVAASKNSFKEDGTDKPDKQNPLKKSEPGHRDSDKKTEISHRGLEEKTKILLTDSYVPTRDISLREVPSPLGGSVSAIVASNKSVPPKPEDVTRDPEKQTSLKKSPSNVRKMISAFEGSQPQDIRPSIRPPPTKFQSSRIGVEAPTASSQIEGIKTGKSKAAQHISGSVVNSFVTGKSQETLLNVRSGELSTHSQSIGTNPSLKNTSKLLREEEVDTEEEKRSPETLMITPTVEETRFSDRMANELVVVHQASNFSSNKLEAGGNFLLQESKSGERKDLKNSDIVRDSNDNLKSQSNKEGYQYSLESSVAWIFPDEAKHLCITTGDERVMDLMGGRKTEAYTLHEETSFHVSEVEENLMRSGSNINVNKGDKTSHGLRKSNSGSADDNMSSGPVGQAIKIALMAAFGILVLLTRQRKNR